MYVTPVCYQMSRYTSLSCMVQEKEQDLIKACTSGDIDEAKRLFNSGVSVKCRDYVCCWTLSSLTLQLGATNNYLLN